MSGDTRRILWTGGFDSTWLTVDALLRGDRVRTYTYRGGGLPPIKRDEEDAARRRIRHALPAALAGRLVEEVTVDRAVQAETAAWAEMTEAMRKPDGTVAWWSSQNYMLATMPGMTGQRRLEAAFVRGDSLLGHQAALVPILEREGIVLPLRHKRKEAMLADAQARGFAHLLDLTWTCDFPDHGQAGEPCGICTSCLARIIPSAARAALG